MKKIKILRECKFSQPNKPWLPVLSFTKDQIAEVEDIFAYRMVETGYAKLIKTTEKVTEKPDNSDEKQLVTDNNETKRLNTERLENKQKKRRGRPKRAKEETAQKK